MPTVTFNGREIECESGAILRDVLLEVGESPHNGNAQYLNCRGFGTCGTCAVEIVEGEVGEKSGRERWRLDFPPHESENGLRLACQIEVRDDLEIRKYSGFWGQEMKENPER